MPPTADVQDSRPAEIEKGVGRTLTVVIREKLDDTGQNLVGELVDGHESVSFGSEGKYFGVEDGNLKPHIDGSNGV
uniref:Uncharacterized protein n=1 Tax=Mycena chlorophos TaxID=658473 RepID=A0ABQ0M476_MYCCL|nr:predicted protein [Mycena chlorophos]